MARYTATIKTILENGLTIFDFDYSRDENAVAILSNEDLQQGFLDHYYFREVGFETLERFKKMLEVEWKENIGIFDKMLIAYNNEINILSNGSNSSSSRSVFSDTPQGYFDNLTNYATNVTDNTNENKGYNGVTEIELLKTYHDQMIDVKNEFYNKFDNLFMQIY